MHGMGRNMTGAKGADVTLKVPAGTQIFEDDNETLICRPDRASASASCLAKGGNGGFGNAAFQDLDQPGAAPRQSRPAGRGDASSGCA